MATDFTVIIRVRQHFGNNEAYLKDVEPGLPFVGPTKDFPFDCPNVSPGAEAVLMFQTRDVDSTENVIRINEADVPQPTVYGGIPVSPNKNTWNGNIMLIRAGALRETNELHIESRNSSGGGGGDIDDFIIDNVVVLYKTREARSPGGIAIAKEDIPENGAIGDLYGTFMLQIERTLKQAEGDRLQATKLGLAQLQESGVITSHEVGLLGRICDLVFGLAHGDGDLFSVCSEVRGLYQDMLSKPESSPVSLAIASIATDSCFTNVLSGAQDLQTARAANAGRSNTIDAATVGGAIAGALVGVGIGGVPGAIVGTVIGGIVGGATAIFTSK